MYNDVYMKLCKNILEQRDEFGDNSEVVKNAQNYIKEHEKTVNVINSIEEETITLDELNDITENNIFPVF